MYYVFYRELGLTQNLIHANFMNQIMMNLTFEWFFIIELIYFVPNVSDTFEIPTEMGTHGN